MQSSGYPQAENTRNHILQDPKIVESIITQYPSIQICYSALLLPLSQGSAHSFAAQVDRRLHSCCTPPPPLRLHPHSFAARPPPPHLWGATHTFCPPPPPPLQVDDHVWTEVKNFMKCLIQMNAAKVGGG